METPSPDPDPAPDTFDGLATELRRSFRAWEEAGGDGAAWPEGRFERLALRAFRIQFRENPLYRRYCERRDAVPGAVGSWIDVPPVPTAVFREVDLVTGGANGSALAFRTSGTTRGEGRRGRHVVREPSLYRASLEAAFRRLVLRADGLPPLERARFCLLVPPFRASDDSSLSWMADALAERFGDGDEVRAAGTGDAGGLEPDAATRATRRSADDGRPLCVLATTLALDAWTRRMDEAGVAVRLPEASRVVDTGGAKGREGLRRDDVLDRAADTLGPAAGAAVNEFGMTELLSQRYSAPGARSGSRDHGSATEPSADADGRGGPWLHGPPWLRTRAVDPVTLDEVPPGEEGILCHFDLANVGSACAVLTEDRGRVRDDGAVRWIGRTPGARPRGCSLATAQLLEGAG